METDLELALQKLRKLDLSTYPYQEIKEIILQLGKVGAIKVTLHRGRTFVRVRPNDDNMTFTKKAELSYKPQHLNKTYQRASTPNETMFYGSMLAVGDNSKDLNARIVGALEGLPWLRDNKTKGVQKVTFSLWEVVEDIDLIAVVHHKDYYDKNSNTKELVDGFKLFMANYPELEERTIMVSDFFAQEYAKIPIEKDYQYMLSAIYSEMVINSGLHGVYYPSVRTEGRGFNVAIKPEIADKHISLRVVGEVMIYKYLDKTIADNFSIVQVPFDQEVFELKPVEDKYCFGEENCLKHLGVNSIEDLKKMN